MENNENMQPEQQHEDNDATQEQRQDEAHREEVPEDLASYSIFGTVVVGRLAELLDNATKVLADSDAFEAACEALELEHFNRPDDAVLDDKEALVAELMAMANTAHAYLADNLVLSEEVEADEKALDDYFYQTGLLLVRAWCQKEEIGIELPLVNATNLEEVVGNILVAANSSCHDLRLNGPIDYSIAGMALTIYTSKLEDHGISPENIANPNHSLLSQLNAFFPTLVNLNPSLIEVPMRILIELEGNEIPFFAAFGLANGTSPVFNIFILTEEDVSGETKFVQLRPPVMDQAQMMQALAGQQQQHEEH